jgi:coenzyme PQQ precursor peptide PqqA
MHSAPRGSRAAYRLFSVSVGCSFSETHFLAKAVFLIPIITPWRYLGVRFGWPTTRIQQAFFDVSSTLGRKSLNQPSRTCATAIITIDQETAMKKQQWSRPAYTEATLGCEINCYAPAEI